MLENKSTLKGKKPNKQKIWEAISMKFDGRDGKQTEECWKNLRKRVIEKKRIIDESANRTGGGVASNVTRLSPLEERILSIIKFAVPILGVDDSNSVSTEASSLSHQIDSENSKSLKPPMPKRNFTREFSEQITPQEQMVMNQKMSWILKQSGIHIFMLSSAIKSAFLYHRQGWFQVSWSKLHRNIFRW